MPRKERDEKRRDNKGRLLKSGESQRSDGRYAYKYIDTFGEPQFVYSWKLVPTDKVPAGKRPCLSLREKIKQIQKDLDDGIDTIGKKMTVCQLYEKYTRQRGNVRKGTQKSRQQLMKLLSEDKLGAASIDSVKLSDAKEWALRMQEKGVAYNTICNSKRSLKAIFYMAVQDDCLRKNPFDFQINEVINDDVRLSRCFFFVSDVLRQVIENGGTKSAVNEKLKKLPLEIPMEKRSQFAYSEVPIPASEIAKRINALADNDTMQKLTYSGILTWLTEIGMMECALTPDGKRTKRPTKIGEETGISVEERTSSNGPYQVVVYNNAAQHFIIDNLDAILTAENMQTEMQGAPWTKDHDDCLIDLYKKSVPVSEMAITLKRSTSAVRGRLKKLGFDA